MPRKQLQNMQLPESGYNPVVFQGYTTEGPEYDTNILANSIGRLDTAIKEASDKQGAVNLALGEIRSQLNPEEYEWFDRYTRENYINPIQDEINAGNYGSAITLGTRLGTEAAKDFEFQDRARVNTEFNKWKDELKIRRDKGDINDVTYQRALALNKYTYNPVYDNNGRNIGGYNWEAAFNPVSDINLDDFYKRLQEFKGVSAETTGYEGGTTQDFYTANGQNAAIKSTKTGGSKTEQTSEVTAKDWQKAFDAYLVAHPEDKLALEQAQANAKYLWSLQYMKSIDQSLTEDERSAAKVEADKRWKDITDDQGGLLDSDMYIRKIAQPMFDVMAYRKHSLITKAGDTLVDSKSLQQKVLADAIFNGNVVSADLYAKGYSMKFIQANSEERKILLNEGKSMRNELVSDVVEQ